MNTYTKQNLNSHLLTSDRIFEDSNFDGIDFTSYNLKSLSFFDCAFNNCHFANASFVNVSLKDVVFKSCNLMGINWCQLQRLEMLKFIDCKLDYSIFQGIKLKRIEIIHCSVIDADFSEADLSSSNFAESNFQGTTFDKANLSGVDFRSSRDYLFDVRTTRIKGAKFSFPYVISLLTVLGAEVEIS